MKRDARIGLAVVLVVGLAITLLVARSIHQNGTQAGIDQDPLPQQEAASRTDQHVTDAGATLDPASNAQMNAVMEFQTRHDYVPGPTTDASGTDAAGTTIDLPPNPAGNPPGAIGSTNGTITTDRQLSSIGTGILPPLGEPPVPFGGNTHNQTLTVNTLGSYTIAAGDNPWKISAKVFGDGKYAQKIMDANPGLNPAKLRIGQKVNIPAIANAAPRVSLENATGNSTANPLIAVSGPVQQEFTTDAGPVPPAGGGTIGQVTTSAQTHVVQAGDTLGRIAAKYLGSSGPKTVKKLMDANPGVDAKRLKVGQELKIPTP